LSNPYPPDPESKRAARQGGPTSNQSKKPTASHQNPQERGTMPYRRPRQLRQNFSNDVQQLRGTVSVVTARDRIGGTGFFRVSHISRGGDVVWTSPPLADLDRADAAAEVLAAFLGATVHK
jgi:hypothetical protein